MLSSPFVTSFGNSRWSLFYIAPGYVPECWFDGVNHVTGGGSVYNTYKSIINSRLADPSPMTIDIYESKGNVTVDVALEDDVPSGCKIYLLACENHVEYGGKTYQFLERCENNQWPIINGQALGIENAGESTTFTASYDFDDLSYQDPLMMYLICWVEDMDSQSSTYKKVMQSAQLFDPPYDSDLDIQPTSLGHIKSLYK